LANEEQAPNGDGSRATWLCAFGNQ